MHTLLLKYKNTTWCQKWDAIATLTLQPPALFDFSKLDDWPKWIKRFEQYCVASGFSKDSETRQVSTLLYCLGDEAEDVLSSTNISEEDKTNYSKVLETEVTAVTKLALTQLGNVQLHPATKTLCGPDRKP